MDPGMQPAEPEFADEVATDPLILEPRELPPEPGECGELPGDVGMDVAA